VRQTLPARREAETFDFHHGPIRYTATVGRFRGTTCEVFLNSAKAGSATDSAARDAAIAVSIALQHGADIETLRKAMTRNGDGSPSSPIGKLLDLLEAGE
jgi:hypothetical protein